MRLTAGSLVVVAGFLGCAHGLRLAPETGGEFGSATQNGVTLEADPDSWDGAPAGLEAYLTPIEVHLVNDTDRPLRVSHADFALVDANGFRYAAVDLWGGGRQGRGDRRQAPRPAPGQQGEPGMEEAPEPPASPGEPEGEPQGDPEGEGASRDEETGAAAEEAALQQARGPGAASVEAALEGAWTGILLAQGRGSAPPPRATAPSRAGRSRGSVAPPPRSRGTSGYVPRRSHSSWYIGPGYGYGYWPYSWGPWYGPEYRVWIQGGDGSYRAGGDILRFALPEGTLEPGGRVAGYVYFRAAGSRADRVTLSWHAHTSGGQFLGTLSVPFRSRR